MPAPAPAEIDQTLTPGPNGLEFHASSFISNYPKHAAATESKDVFDSTGTSCNEYVLGAPGYGPKGSQCPLFGDAFALQYHTYKLVWTPTWIAWMIDSVVYRNSTAAPWRPVNMRPLLRTNSGVSASTTAMSNVRHRPPAPRRCRRCSGGGGGGA